MEEEKQKMYNYMEDIINGRGYEFLNMNDYYDEMGLDFAADFSDYGGHVNAVGAEKCSTFLGRYLVEHYGIEDKREKRALKAGMRPICNGRRNLHRQSRRLPGGSRKRILRTRRWKSRNKEIGVWGRGLGKEHGYWNVRYCRVL